MSTIVYFVDFEDSFTFNVISELKKININPEILTPFEWKNRILNSAVQKTLTILGPGPGHPHDYQLEIELKACLDQAHHHFFGVCLGHQLLAGALGFEVQRCREPIHGQSLEYKLPSDWQQFLNLPGLVQVQRYNSLAPITKSSIKHPQIESAWVIDHEIIGMRGERFLSYQFHPESIGTSYRNAFFKPLKQFIL